MAENYRLALIGGPEGVRRAWRQLLAELPQVNLVFDSATLPANLEALADLSPDILLVAESRIDWTPSKPGLLRRWPDPEQRPALVVSCIQLDARLLKLAVRAGASAIAQATEGLPGLKRALALAAEASHRIAFEELNEAFRSDAIPSYGLSSHARLRALDEPTGEMLRHFSSGLSDAQLAKELEIGLPTLRKQFRRVLAELELDTREQLLLMLYELEIHGRGN